jgi:hypothetical protein
MFAGHYSFDGVTYPFDNTNNDMTAISSAYKYGSSMQTNITLFTDLGAHNTYVDLGFLPTS